MSQSVATPDAVVAGRDVLPQPAQPHLHGRGPHLVLVGFMGAGKSTVGKLLAADRDHPFIDLDLVLEQQAGRTIAEIFATDGEAFFRDLESDVLAQVCADLGHGPDPTTAPAQPHVIATGGGIMERERNRILLRKLGVCVWLTAPWPALIARISGLTAGSRPLVADDSSAAHAELEQRFHRRRATYASADFVVQSDRPLAEVARAVDAAQGTVVRQLRVSVPLATQPYTVVVGGGALTQAVLQVAQLNAPRVLIVADSQVAQHWLSPLKEALHTVAMPFDVHLLPVGEPHKTLETVAAIWDKLLDLGADRSLVVIALGGGVTGDMAGFAAATALRGLRVVQLPTSMLAMVDASVGGKTGFNRRQGKNLVGAFHQPSWVGCDLTTLRTLSHRDRMAGLAEVVKVALTLDGELLSWLERDAELLRSMDHNEAPQDSGEHSPAAQNPAWLALRALIARAIGLKATVVARDEREGGLRRVLNFGHTVGHAIERATDYSRYRHGEAISLGMVAALTASVDAGCCQPVLVERALRLLQALGLPTQLPADIARADIRAALAHDKKRAAAGVRMILCAGPGHYAERWLRLEDIPLEP